MNDQYLDLSETFIDLTVSLVKLNTKNAMGGDVELDVINNLAHSMFSQVQVKFGGVVVENSNGLYGYNGNNQKIKQIQDLFKEEKDFLMETRLYSL